jgi:hypothetical protein
MTITWSADGGMGGCADTCDWATSIYDFRVFSPGALPLPVPVTAPEVTAGPGCDAPTVTLIEQSPSGAGATLRAARRCARAVRGTHLALAAPRSPPQSRRASAP